jgi:glycosyltransferase involved in cell wall biosynthesis
MKRKRIAIWIHGGIGNGNYSQGYPMLEKLIEGMSRDFTVVVYSHTVPNAGFTIDKFAFKYPPRSITSAKLRWIILSLIFLKDHITNPFKILFGFWGYPTAFVIVILGKLLRLKTVVSVLGADSASIPSIDYGIFHRPFQRKMATWAYMRATGLLTISDFQKNNLLKLGIEREMTTIPWGADASMYRFAPRKRLEPLRFIHVGHINPVKDQETLLRAFKIISDSVPATLQIFGLDTLDGKMHSLAERLGISSKVNFQNMVPYDQMPKHMGEADIMLHTSLSEAQCMALTEAAATGVLLAGTNVGILHDLGEKCGIVVDVGDFQSLAKKVLHIIGNPVEWESKVECARAWSEGHDLGWTIKTINAYLRSV